MLIAGGFVWKTTAVRAATTVSLGTADSFAVLAKSAITDTTPSTITGNVGLNAVGTQYLVPVLTTGEVAGVIYADDATGPGGVAGNNPGLMISAQADLTTAYGNASQPNAGVNGGVIAGGDLGGMVLTPGVYEDDNAPNSLAITGTVTLDGQGDPNAVFILKSGSTLTTAAGSVVNLINGTQACNVFWQVASSATFGIGSTFKGNVMALVSITDNGNSIIDGRLLARTGAVTLNNTHISRAVCAVPVQQDVSTGAINVVKLVINDNGGTKTIADFPLFVNGVSVISGVTNIFPATNHYVVTETSDSHYTQTFSGDCDINGGLNLYPGSGKVCIITNDDIGVPVVVPPVPPLIDVVKVPSPLALPNGPGLVNYSYTLKNIGTVPVTNITMVGDTCSPIVLASGDLNNNAKLEVNETWVYRCSTTLAATHTNTVVATGWANGLSATDIASSTVVVGLPVVPPLIHVTKIPSPLVLFAGGGVVTYTEKITNPGTVALSNVRLIDDKCSPMTRISGDLNGDLKLDTNETWTYLCRTFLTKTTTNTAIASGEANGLSVRDFAMATVVVGNTPTLPKTGFAPRR